MNLVQDVSELISWRDTGDGKNEALKLIYKWLQDNPPSQESQRRDNHVLGTD